jgi:hypothetical protein
MGKWRTRAYTDQTSGQGPGPPREQTGPPGWVLDLFVWGPCHSQQGPRILGQRILLELALLGKLIQWRNENNVNKVLTRGGNSSVNLASQGHCTGVFIGA